MANVFIRLSLSTFDDAGGRSTIIAHAEVPDTATLAQANTALAALKTAYLTVGQNGIQQAEFSMVNKTLASATTGAERAGAGGVLDFAAGTPATTYGLWVPGVDDTNVLADGTIDIKVDPWLTFAGDFASGAAVMGGVYTNPAYAALGAALDAFSTNRKRSKRVGRKRA